MNTLAANITDRTKLEDQSSQTNGRQVSVNSTASNHPLNIIIAGGGTGGHLFPGIAIAETFSAKNPENNILFVNAGKPIDKAILTDSGYDFKCISSEGIKGKNLWQKVKSILKIPKGIFESMTILKTFSPDIVIGVGGYSSGPLVISAWLSRIPTVLHEQNILPGITNRILSHFANRIYVTFEKTIMYPEKTRVTGNPVRNEILQCADRARISDTEDADTNRPFTVLVLGGSLGAHSINMAVIDALKHIEGKEQYHFIHQTGTPDENIVKDAYGNNNIQNKVQSFFNNMAEQYSNADLIICRAGATTIAEVSAIGKGVIFVPYPFAADNHQLINAQTLADKGAAQLIEDINLEGEHLAAKIVFFEQNRKALREMAEQLMNFGNPDAAKYIVEDCYGLLKKRDK